MQVELSSEAVELIAKELGIRVGNHPNDGGEFISIMLVADIDSDHGALITETLRQHKAVAILGGTVTIVQDPQGEISKRIKVRVLMP